MELQNFGVERNLGENIVQFLYLKIWSVEPKIAGGILPRSH